MKNRSFVIESILLAVKPRFVIILSKKWLLFLLPAMLVAGCKKVTEETGLVGVCPIVLTTAPLDHAVAVSTNTTVQAQFNEPVEASSINTLTFTLAQGSTPIAGVVAYADSVATFTPVTMLTPNTTYTATVTMGVKDIAKNSPVSDYVWTFTTGDGPDLTAPTVISTIPVNNAIAVALNTKVSAVFSEAMNPLTIPGSFTLTNTSLGGTDVVGTVTYSGTTAVFSPTANLLPGTTYTATITTGAKDMAGNPLAAKYTWDFTTIADIPPTVTATDPANLATGVAYNKIITATFSKAMDPLTITGLTYTVKNGVTPVAGVVTYSGTTASFKPSALLTSGVVYTATITTGAKDVAGSALAANYTWNFTALVDIIPPTVISTDPVNLATSVPIDKIITANFSELMTPSTITALTFTLMEGDIPVAGIVTYTGTKATFTPSAPLAINTVYTATITTGVKDLAGNAMVSNYVWTFQTLLPPPPLGAAANFGGFGGSAGVTNQGLNTVINNGRIGSTAASTLITGLHDGLTGDIYTETPLNVGNVTGGIFTAPPLPGTATSFAVATQAQSDATIAYNDISPASKPGGTDPGAGELGGLTLGPNVYQSAGGTFKITNGDLTLDAKGDANAVWIFQSASSLTVGTAGPAGARTVNLINGAQAKNVFWYVGSQAVINGAGGGVMVGTIIAYAGVTFSTAGNAVQTVLNGRALSLNASVTLVNTTINVP